VAQLAQRFALRRIVGQDQLVAEILRAFSGDDETPGD
jgi:hypothetical protein